MGEPQLEPPQRRPLQFSRRPLPVEGAGASVGRRLSESEKFKEITHPPVIRDLDKAQALLTDVVPIEEEAKRAELMEFLQQHEGQWTIYTHTSQETYGFTLIGFESRVNDFVSNVTQAGGLIEFQPEKMAKVGVLETTYLKPSAQWEGRNIHSELHSVVKQLREEGVTHVFSRGIPALEGIYEEALEYYGTENRENKRFFFGWNLEATDDWRVIRENRRKEALHSLVGLFSFDNPLEQKIINSIFEGLANELGSTSDASIHIQSLFSILHHALEKNAPILDKNFFYLFLETIQALPNPELTGKLIDGVVTYIQKSQPAVLEEFFQYLLDYQLFNYQFGKDKDTLEIFLTDDIFTNVFSKAAEVGLESFLQKNKTALHELHAHVGPKILEKSLEAESSTDYLLALSRTFIACQDYEVARETLQQTEKILAAQSQSETFKNRGGQTHGYRIKERIEILEMYFRMGELELASNLLPIVEAAFLDLSELYSFEVSSAGLEKIVQLARTYESLGIFKKPEEYINAVEETVKKSTKWRKKHSFIGKDEYAFIEHEYAQELRDFYARVGVVDSSAEYTPDTSVTALTPEEELLQLQQEWDQEINNSYIKNYCEVARKAIIYHFKTGDVDRALELCQEVVGLQEDVWQFLGQHYTEIGEAIDQFGQMEATYDNHAWVRLQAMDQEKPFYEEVAVSLVGAGEEHRIFLLSQLIHRELEFPWPPKICEFWLNSGLFPTNVNTEEDIANLMRSLRKLNHHPELQLLPYDYWYFEAIKNLISHKIINQPKHLFYISRDHAKVADDLIYAYGENKRITKFLRVIASEYPAQAIDGALWCVSLSQLRESAPNISRSGSLTEIDWTDHVEQETLRQAINQLGTISPLIYETYRRTWLITHTDEPPLRDQEFSLRSDYTKQRQRHESRLRDLEGNTLPGKEREYQAKIEFAHRSLDELERTIKTAMEGPWRPMKELVRSIYTLRTRFHSNYPLIDLQPEIERFLSRNQLTLAEQQSFVEVLAEIVYVLYAPVGFSYETVLRFLTELLPEENRLVAQAEKAGLHWLPRAEISNGRLSWDSEKECYVGAITASEIHYSVNSDQEPAFVEAAKHLAILLNNIPEPVHSLLSKTGQSVHRLQLLLKQPSLEPFTLKQIVTEGYRALETFDVWWPDNQYAMQAVAGVDQVTTQDITTALTRFLETIESESGQEIEDESYTAEVYLSKNVASFFAKASVGLCTAEDLELYLRSDHFHLNVINRETGQVMANLQLYVEDADCLDPSANEQAEKILVIRGLNPSDRYLSEANSHSWLELFFTAAQQLALQSGMGGPYMVESTGWHIHTNRPLIIQRLQTFYRQRTAISLVKPFNVKGGDPFSEYSSSEKVKKVYRVNG